MEIPRQVRSSILSQLIITMKPIQEPVVTQEVPMDIDPSKYFIILILLMLKLLADGRASSLPVRQMPYSLVPGIIINSRPFLKAVSIITKQQETANIASRVIDTPVAGSSIPRGKEKHSSGMSYEFFIAFS